ncbi:MAG TPA: DegT/DnrJ/EryC1/StrS family aminotransferase, partial [Bryobacteraceae bacterium]|nr:DegT/DnrJ/EryC1/StrS family aminotransferase [Bryobacteraceae bacterium]
MPEPDKPNRTRRVFVQSAVAGLAAGRANPQTRETLAIFGGPPAVTFPAAKATAVVKWPRYGVDERNALNALLESNQWYAEIPLLEKELKDRLNVPYVKSHMNATSALMSMFFALRFEPGSEILAPSYTAWATTAPMHLFQYVPS